MIPQPKKSLLLNDSLLPYLIAQREISTAPLRAEKHPCTNHELLPTQLGNPSSSCYTRARAVLDSEIFVAEIKAPHWVSAE